MKSQIISKLTQPARHASLLGDSYHSHQLVTFTTQPDSRQEYYPASRPAALPPRQFMDQLNQHCHLRYEKVQHQPQPLQRKLEAILEKKVPQQPRHTTVNLFSFKKGEQPQGTQRSQQKENHYYVRPSQPQRNRLRKFHSLASLRSQESTEEDSQRFPDASQVVGAEGGDKRRRQGQREKGSGWEEKGKEEGEKQRLARIRRELNEVYQMGRNKVRLCLA